VLAGESQRLARSSKDYRILVKAEKISSPLCAQRDATVLMGGGHYHRPRYELRFTKIREEPFLRHDCCKLSISLNHTRAILPISQSTQDCEKISSYKNTKGHFPEGILYQHRAF
jgi:hypothetical protein